MAEGNSGTPLSRLDVLIDGARSMFRQDGWINVALGLGTNRDKTTHGFHGFQPRLQDDELTSMYQSSDLAAKVVNLYPREAFRIGYCLRGLEPDKLEEAEDYLRQFNLPKLFTNCWIWARLYGGGALWLGTDDNSPSDMPLADNPKRILFMRFFDRRFLYPYSFYKKGPKVGLPEVYLLTNLTLGGIGSEVGRIHETRLVFFPGALTDHLTKVELNHWDLSVLQVAYNALRSDGSIWKSTELLISDANQAVFKIKGLWAKVMAKQQAKLQERVSIIDMTRSVARAMLIDKDDEEFERQTTNFAGLADLDKASLQRVATASDIPYSLLVRSPEGLGAKGDGDLQWFYGHVKSLQEQEAEPIVRTVLERLLGAEDSPLAGEDLSEMEIHWHPLWAPTAVEKAEIEKLEAEADSIRISDQIVLPEEVAVSRMGGEDGGPLKINVEARQRILDADEKASKAAAGGDGDPFKPTPAALPPAPGDVSKDPNGAPLKPANKLPVPATKGTP